MATERKVLLAVDDSEHSTRAVTFFLEQVTRPGDSVLIVNHIEPHLFAVPFEGQALHQLMEKEIVDSQIAAQKLCDDLTEQLKTYGLESKVFVQISSDGPGAYICDVARREGVELIVMGSRGMGTLRRTFLGSVSDFVLHHAHVPVVIVPPPKVL